jgi:biotin operon repressor
VAAQSSGPAFPVHVDERELAEDLGHASKTGRAAIEPMIKALKANGVPIAWLGRCDPEAQDGTRLPGCVKLYIPQPAGQWGAVFLGGSLDGRPTLFLLAIGRRHPEASWKPSVYEIAHRRLNRRESSTRRDRGSD